MDRKNKRLLVWITVCVPRGSGWWTGTQPNTVHSVTVEQPNMFNLANARSAMQDRLDLKRKTRLSVLAPPLLELEQIGFHVSQGVCWFYNLLATIWIYATLLELKKMWHLWSIHGISACRGFESSQLENVKTEKVLDGFVSRRPREELVSCSVEVLHGWALVSLVRPPSRLGAVFFQDQMDGSYISTESFAMETTCMHLPDRPATQHTSCRHIADIKQSIQISAQSSCLNGGTLHTTTMGNTIFDSSKDQKLLDALWHMWNADLGSNHPPIKVFALHRS